MTFIKSFQSAHEVSTPLLAIRTFDNRSTIDAIKNHVKTSDGADGVIALVQWDCIKGISGINQFGLERTKKAIKESNSNIELTLSLRETLRVLNHIGEDVIVFISNAHLFWNEPEVIQGIWNLRDPFKADGSMLVLLVSSGSILPSELSHDFLILDEPLPTEDKISQIITGTFENAGLEHPSEEVTASATKALIGLPAFPAEQAVAMCLDIESQTLDINGLWTRKKQAINQTRGLAVLETNASLEDLGGLQQIKNYLTRVMDGKDSPNVILFWDEIEKDFAGMGTDTSGTKTSLAGSVLTWSQDTGVRGLIGVGLPGVGKSEIAKAIGTKFGKPVISVKLSDMESGIVGSSNENWRNAQAVLDSISNKKIFVIATCNKITSLPPELKRRFSDAIFFFDAPTDEERKSIWKVYLSKYQIEEDLPDDSGWTGAEIKKCVLTAYRLNISLKEAAEYVIPVTVSDSVTIEDLRRSSSDKYLSASYPGRYTYEPEQVDDKPEDRPNGRKMRNK